MESHDKAWENLETVLNSKLAINDSWNKIIDLESDLVPADYWAQLRTLNVQADQDNILKQLERVVTDSPMPENIIALWIGIIKLWDEKESKEYYSIYLAGSDSYDVEDADWAVDLAYFPPNCYISSEVLNSVDHIIAVDRDNYSFLDWILPITYTALTVSDIIERRLNKSLFLKYKKGLFFTKSKESLFVTVGYDDGDFISIQSIDK
jgi:hypothetical protein